MWHLSVGRQRASLWLAMGWNLREGELSFLFIYLKLCQVIRVWASSLSRSSEKCIRQLKQKTAFCIGLPNFGSQITFNVSLFIRSNAREFIIWPFAGFSTGKKAFYSSAFFSLHLSLFFHICTTLVLDRRGSNKGDFCVTTSMEYSFPRNTYIWDTLLSGNGNNQIKEEP